MLFNKGATLKLETCDAFYGHRLSLLNAGPISGLARAIPFGAVFSAARSKKHEKVTRRFLHQ